MLEIVLGLALFVVLVQAVEHHRLRRRLDEIERHTDRRIDLAMNQIDELHAYRERTSFHHWN